jgi:hypothetical protein
MALISELGHGSAKAWIGQSRWWVRLQHAPPTETGTELHTAVYNPIRKRQSLNSSAIVLIVLLAYLCSNPRVVGVLLLRSLESGRIFGK